MITIKQDDTHNALVEQLLKNDKPIDLTDCKVYICIEGLIYEDECMILDPENGKVSYLLGRISHKVGRFRYEFVVKYNDGTQEIIPNSDYKQIRIIDRIGE